jgi:2-succinyl-5-enolpyruvyl-6-hydroxy-3-cyclohexene-1-carboxylate synthase
VANSPAQVFAAQLLAGLAQAGAQRVFLAPGARSQALAIAAGQLAEAEAIELAVRLDERGLGFAALGAALASGEPSVVVTTSGTAVANLHPAVLEAHHSGIPMILLTADRPVELRGVGANQTTNQVGIFADAVRACVDVPAPTESLLIGSGDDAELSSEVVDLIAEAYALSIGLIGKDGQTPRPGPVQLNLQFREPLSSITPAADGFLSAANGEAVAARLAAIAAGAAKQPAPKFAIVDAAVPTVVVAGAESGPAAVELAESWGWPLLAEPSSGARYGGNAVLAYRLILEQRPEISERIGRVIVFGKPTLSRAVMALFKRLEIEVFVVRESRLEDFNVGGRAQHVDEVTVSHEVDGAWLTEWLIADQEIRLSAPANGELSRRELVEAVWEATTEENLVVGASRLIREADTWAPAKIAAVYANRGLAGIDGTISTAMGIAQATGRKTRVLVGDLTALHDASSLAANISLDVLPAMQRPDMQIIIGNDGGGSIFAGLEPAKLLAKEQFERLFATPQDVNFADLAKAYNWDYRLIKDEAALRRALDMSGRWIFEVRLER